MTVGRIYIRDDGKRIYFVDPTAPSDRAYTLSRITLVVGKSSFSNNDVMSKDYIKEISLDQEKLLDAIVGTYNGEEE